MNELTKAIQTLETPEQRVSAVARLGASGGPDATLALLELLVNSHGEVRAAAARALGQCGGAQALASLQKMARSDTFGTAALWALLSALISTDVRSPADPLTQKFVAGARPNFANLRDAGMTAPRSLEGAIYWVGRLAYDLARPELRALAIDAFDALGPVAEEALVAVLLGRSHSLKEFEPLGLERILRWVLEHASRTVEDAVGCMGILASDPDPLGFAALVRVVSDPGTTFVRKAALLAAASARDPGRQAQAQDLLQTAAVDSDPIVAVAAARLLRDRGLPVPPRTVHSSRSLPETAPMAPSQRVLSNPLPSRDMGRLLERLAHALGVSGELRSTDETNEDLPELRPGWHRTRGTSHWSWGDLGATLTTNGEWHDHEGGGASEELTLDFPDHVTIALSAGLLHYEVHGDGEAAMRCERAFREVLGALGWAEPPRLSWHDGFVALSRFKPTVRFTSSAVSWEIELPVGTGMFCFLEAKAELLEDMLLVWTSCEHANAGGGPFLFELHRVLPQGVVAWSRQVDLLPRHNRARVVGGVFEVFAGWTKQLTDTDKPDVWRRLDPETGRDETS